MKKTLLIIVPGLLISMVPMIGAYVFYNGPEWVRACDGLHLTISCVIVVISIFIGTFYYLTEG